MTARIMTILILSFAINVSVSASPDNLLANPFFNEDVTFWQPAFTTPVWSSDDANGLGNSGSMELQVGGDIPLGASQCVSVGATDQMQVSLDARRSSGAMSSTVHLSVSWNSAPSCPDGSTISSPSHQVVIGSVWQRLTTVFSRPPSAVSARVFISASTSGANATVRADNVYFGVSKLFSDRFEIQSVP